MEITLIRPHALALPLFALLASCAAPPPPFSSRAASISSQEQQTQQRASGLRDFETMESTLVRSVVCGAVAKETARVVENELRFRAWQTIPLVTHAELLERADSIARNGMADQRCRSADLAWTALQSGFPSPVMRAEATGDPFSHIGMSAAPTGSSSLMTQFDGHIVLLTQTAGCGYTTSSNASQFIPPLIRYFAPRVGRTETELHTRALAVIRLSPPPVGSDCQIAQRYWAGLRRAFGNVPAAASPRLGRQTTPQEIDGPLKLPEPPSTPKLDEIQL